MGSEEEEEDAEMKEMLEMIEAAKGDLEVVKDDDVMGMIENINDDKYFEKIKPSSKEKKRKQQGTESSQDDASNKKRSTFKDRKVSSGTMEWYAKMCQKVDSEIEAEEPTGDKNSESISVEPVVVVKAKMAFLNQIMYVSVHDQARKDKKAPIPLCFSC